MQPVLRSLDHLVLTVQDIENSVAFYRDILGMKPEVFSTADGSRRTALKFGQQKINLHPADGPFDPKAANPAPGTADLCFLTDVPLADWTTHLQGAGIEIEDGPVPRTGATGPIMSLYLRDPDSNLIEIATRDI